ncbi:hypothetical protein V1512DRAFT_142853 [Lipomyces arxii]|uniref:uncharacterized protein n=1 Tax=Lipomyces arxii TaxID=56418 RepID=UPI0034CD1EB0
MKGYFRRAHNMLPLPDHSQVASQCPMRIFLPNMKAKIVYPPSQTTTPALSNESDAMNFQEEKLWARDSDLDTELEEKQIADTTENETVDNFRSSKSNNVEVKYEEFGIDIGIDDSNTSMIPKVRLPPASVYKQATPEPAPAVAPATSTGPPEQPYTATSYQQHMMPVPMGTPVGYPISVGSSMAPVMTLPPAVPPVPQEYRLTPEVMHQPRPTKAMSVADIEPPNSHSPVDGQQQKYGYSFRPHRGYRSDNSQGKILYVFCWYCKS